MTRSRRHRQRPRFQPQRLLLENAAASPRQRRVLDSKIPAVPHIFHPEAVRPSAHARQVWGGDDDLIVSFDGGNAFRPWKINRSWSTKGGWWHVDQVCRFAYPYVFCLNASQNSLRGPHRCGRVCVQGLVTYYDATEDTGGLCVIPASHRAHDELCNRSASAKSLIDFVSVNAHDPILSGGGILVCAQAGGTGRCATQPPPTPLILCLLQIWCCGTVELCTATLQRCRKHISSHCLRKNSGSTLQRSRGISFGCAATCA